MLDIFPLSPVPEFCFKDTRVIPAHAELMHHPFIPEESNLLSIALQTPAQLKPFESFLTRFDKLEHLQAAAYSPGSELRIVLAASPALLTKLEQFKLKRLQAAHFNDPQLSIFVCNLSKGYQFKQLEKAPIL